MKESKSYHHKEIYKDFCNRWRSQLNVTNLLSFGISKDKTQLVCILFDKDAGDNDFHETYYDEEKGFYIEVI